MAIINTPLLGLPYAGADTDETYAVLSGLFVKDGQKPTLPEIVERYTPTIGSVYIKAADWTAADGTADAYDAKITISGVEPDSMILIYPATDGDAEKAKRLGIRAKAAPGVASDDTFVIVRATSGDPTVTEGIGFIYIALRGFSIWNAGLTPPGLTPPGFPSATVIGVDPYIATEEGDRDDIAASQRLVTEVAGLRLKSADLPTKLDEYRAAKGLIDKTVSDLVNYYNKSETLTKAEINALVSAIPKFDIEVVTSLPTSNISETTVYLVKSGADSSNLYTEYIRANGAWERLGTQTVDLTGYATEAWVNDILAAYVKTVDMEAYVTEALNGYITKEEADETYAKPSDVVQATYTALQTAKESGEFDGHTPINGVDFNTPEEKAELKTFIVTEIAKRGQIKPEFANSIEECTDATKLYVLPDGYIYASVPVERPVYTNLLTSAVGTDGQPYNGGLGYQSGLKISSAGVESSVTGMCSTGFIPVTGGGTIRIKNTTKASGTGVSGADFHLFYKENFTIAASGYYGYYDSGSYNTKPDENGVITFTLPSNAVYYRYTTGVINEDSIFTVNEEITDETMIVYEWRNTGLAFVPADYEDRIVDLETASEDHETRLSEIEEKLENGDFDGEKTFAERVADYKNWDRPIYDRIPVYTIGDESKPALTTEMRTSAALYQAYEDLMELVNTDSWTYITKTPLGQDSAGYDVYRYDFMMPDQPRTAVTALSKAVPKVILVSGVHPEWAGVYALYNTMYEIATNPDLADLKHNTHFVVMPMVNAYSCNTSNRKNINGVDIARNFEVDWVETADTSASTYGGTEPLSELEAQYVDQVMSANTDALYFISCHNYFGGEDYLNLWACAATKYTHNLGKKLVDKLTRAWDKYDFVPANTYLGAADMAAPNGSEGKQAIKYGIQGLTLECRNGFGYRSTDTYTAFSQSRATEVYINFLLTALGNHEATDKRAL